MIRIRKKKKTVLFVVNYHLSHLRLFSDSCLSRPTCTVFQYLDDGVAFLSLYKIWNRKELKLLLVYVSSPPKLSWLLPRSFLKRRKRERER